MHFRGRRVDRRLLGNSGFPLRRQIDLMSFAELGLGRVRRRNFECWNVGRDLVYLWFCECLLFWRLRRSVALFWRSRCRFLNRWFCCYFRSAASEGVFCILLRLARLAGFRKDSAEQLVTMCRIFGAAAAQINGCKPLVQTNIVGSLGEGAFQQVDSLLRLTI